MSATTVQVIAAAWEAAKQLLLPAVLDEESTWNAEAIRNYIKRGKLEWTTENLVAAVWSLQGEGKILWTVDPVAKAKPTQAERNKAAAAKAFRDNIKNKPGLIDVTKTAKNNASDSAEKAKTAEAKELADLKSRISSRINNYRKSHHNVGTDYSGTDWGRAKLCGVLASVVGGQASDGADKLADRVTSIQLGKTALADVEAAYWKLSS